MAAGRPPHGDCSAGLCSAVFCCCAAASPYSSSSALLAEVWQLICGLSFVNYADEFDFFRAEVLPRLERLGLRQPVTSLS